MPASLEDFDVISTIGTGSYGTCRKIRRKRDGKILVWKEMDYGSMSESEKQMLVSEVNLLRELRHKHIVKYHDRIIDRSRATIYIIMEYCPGGDLASIIARHRKDGTHVTEEFAWKILSQTTLALRECHRRKNGQAVLHRDLKPANVFLDTDSNVKLGDFGLARVLHHETSFARTYVGTPYYMSPVSKRPSIESLLSEPELQRACQRPPLVASGQVPVVARAHGQKENILKQLEALALKEKELERRERNLAVKEKLVEDKLKRANELLQTCHYQETSGAVACPGRKFRPAAMPGPSCNKCPRVCATPAQGQTDQWKP
ncbi:serine/threonine-protein kinase Nek2-like isoform X2 [Physella acuta]|uniref:serine/threonine-protein kinase Nek2-like isoform X2 n=1 Tax=Physella acuta TaxID=109671 RepID=UPI0027DCD80F|nr:serine/threonine-protein kinase Nek2-like isoform X2 [Physella acuta]